MSLLYAMAAYVAIHIVCLALGLALVRALDIVTRRK